jgi:hypothetical protein
MNGVERAPGRDGIADGFLVHVPPVPQGRSESCNVSGAQVGNEVDVVGGPRFPMERAGERTRGHIGDAEPLEDAGEGEPSGAIGGGPPPIDETDGLGAQAQDGQPEEELAFVGGRVPRAQPGDGEEARGPSQLGNAARLFRRRHAGVALEANRFGVGRGIGG